MKNPKITIITATYNLIEAGRREMFHEALRSVFEQDYDNYEHIVIDGASTDGTIDILAEYATKGWITYISEPDTGIYNAYNKGVKMANGDYIAFLNSDDFYTRKDAFSIIVRTLEESQADLTYSSFNVVDLAGKFQLETKPALSFFPLKTPFGHQTVFAKKNVFEDLDFFDESYKIAGDYDFLVRALLQGFSPVEIPGVFVSWRRGGISETCLGVCRSEDLKIIQKTCNLTLVQSEKYFTPKYLPPKIINPLLANLSSTINKEDILKKHKKHFLKYLKKQIFTFKWSEKGHIVRLLGITFWHRIPQ